MSSSFKAAVRPTSRRIVLLEDITDAAADLSERLEQLEYVVLRRSAGDPVAAEIVNLEPDVVLMDIGTPRTNAHRLTTELRNKLRSRALIVAVSRSRREIERGWPKGISIAGLCGRTTRGFCSPSSENELRSRMTEPFNLLPHT
jgi:CheY-like chemotaxis protein